MTAQELARQTLIQLSKSQIPPTPENYQRVYNEISGEGNATTPINIGKNVEKVLSIVGKGKLNH